MVRTMTDSSAAGQGRDFFISYAGVDRAWAEWIAVELERAGYSTFIQAFDFVPGSDFVHLMQKASMEAQRTIAVLSGAYFNSQFGEAEWRVAFAKDPSGEHGLLLPVRVEACQVPGLLQTRVYVDLVAVSEEVARGKLLAAVDRNRPRPTSARFPGEAPPRSTVYPGTHVDASQARGVVVGDNANVVNNFWDTTASPRNDLALGKLSPQVSAQRLLGLPHLEAVAALAHAPIRAAVDVLRVILRREPSRAIGMIADLHPEGVSALVRELTADAPYLAGLPDAVEALEKCQDAMGWTIDQATTEVHRAQRSEAGTDGFFRAYQGGHIHWSASGGAHATVGAMIRGHAHHGGSAGLLGFPVSDETAAGRSPFGTEGTFQRFEFALRTRRRCARSWARGAVRRCTGPRKASSPPGEASVRFTSR
jgi:hypothetical protein